MRTWMYQCVSRSVMRRFKLVTFSFFLGFGLSACSGDDGDVEEPIAAEEGVEGEESAIEDLEATADDGLAAEIAEEDAGEVMETPDDSESISDGEESMDIATTDGETTEVPAEVLDDSMSSSIATDDLGTDAAGAQEAELYDGAGDMPDALAMPAATESDLEFDSAPVAAPQMQMAPIVQESKHVASATASGFGNYVIQPGDSLAAIANKIYGSIDAWEQLAEVNGLHAPYVIYPGNTLKFPTSSEAAQTYAAQYEQIPEQTVVVEDGDTLSSIAERTFGSASGWKIFLVYNNIPNPHRIAVGLTLSYKDPRMMANRLSRTKKHRTSGDSH